MNNRRNRYKSLRINSKRSKMKMTNLKKNIWPCLNKKETQQPTKLPLEVAKAVRTLLMTMK
jgi:hypothetical protein